MTFNILLSFELFNKAIFLKLCYNIYIHFNLSFILNIFLIKIYKNPYLLFLKF
jgi:hypothetical protein